MLIPYIVQWLSFMDDYVTVGTLVAVEKVLDNATFTDCKKEEMHLFIT